MRAKSSRFSAGLLVVALGLAAFAMFGGWAAAQLPGLGTAESFAILAGSTITNTGRTTIDGNVGLHPGSAVTGFDSVNVDRDPARGKRCGPTGEGRPARRL